MNDIYSFFLFLNRCIIVTVPWEWFRAHCEIPYSRTRDNGKVVGYISLDKCRSNVWTHDYTVIIYVNVCLRSGSHAVEVLYKWKSGTQVCGAHEQDHARTTQQRTGETEVSGTFHCKTSPQDSLISSVINVVIFIDYRLLLLCLSIAILASGVHAVSFLSHVFFMVNFHLQTAVGIQLPITYV